MREFTITDAIDQPFEALIDRHIYSDTYRLCAVLPEDFEGIEWFQFLGNGVYIIGRYNSIDEALEHAKELGLEPRVIPD